jgi:hypothetical protein
VLAPAHLEDVDLLAASVRKHRGLDARPASTGVPIFTVSPSPTMSTWSSVISLPTSAGSDSTLSFSPALTRYCLPPVLITAYIAHIPVK